MKRELIEKKGLVSDKTKIMIFYYKSDGIRTSVTGLFKRLTETSIEFINKYEVKSFNLDDIVGLVVLEPRRPKEVQ